jgi:hypothetical protein
MTDQQPFVDDADRCLRLSLVDVWTFNCGRRPRLKSDASVYGLIEARFRYSNIPNHR